MCVTGKNDPNVPPVKGSGLLWKIAGGGSPYKAGRFPPPRIAASSSCERAALNDSKVADAAEAAAMPAHVRILRLVLMSRS